MRAPKRTDGGRFFSNSNENAPPVLSIANVISNNGYIIVIVSAEVHVGGLGLTTVMRYCYRMDIIYAADYFLTCSTG